MNFDVAATYTVFLRTIRDAQKFHGAGTGNMPSYLLRGICIGTESRQFAPDLGLIFIYMFSGVGTRQLLATA